MALDISDSSINQKQTKKVTGVIYWCMVDLFFFRLYKHHPTDIAMEWEQTKLQGQPLAYKAARATKIHIVRDTLISGKL
jgi:hypothetical protein